MGLALDCSIDDHKRHWSGDSLRTRGSWRGQEEAQGQETRLAGSLPSFLRVHREPTAWSEVSVHRAPRPALRTMGSVAFHKSLFPSEL